MRLNTLFLIFYSLFIIGCDTEQPQGNTMTPFTIKAGINPEEYNQLNRLHANKNIDKQPAGLNFYEQSWSSKQKGSIRVDHGDYSFTIPHVLSSTGVEDTEHLENGIFKFSINSSITSNEFIDHDQARTQFMKTIQDLVTLGWHPYIEFYSEPRLLGQQSFQYAIQDESYAPDPMYTPTLDEWMALNSGHSWVFHADNIFMEIGFRRNSQYMDRDGQGVYLLTYRIFTRDAQARNNFEGDEREQWQSLWVENIKKDKIMRYQSEVELIKKGYHINTQYVEPKIHPEDPVEPEGEEAEALLDFIQKNNR